jgi:hypothetical protein
VSLQHYRATSFGEMMAYQLFVGWFEAAFFPGMHYIFGEFHTGSEKKRALAYNL